jgi:hypothetical protein
VNLPAASFVLVSRASTEGNEHRGSILSSADAYRARFTSRNGDKFVAMG